METILTAGLLPTVVLGLLAFLGRAQLESIQSGIRTVSTELKELNGKVGGHGERLAGHDAKFAAHDTRLTALEARSDRRGRR